MAAAHSIGGAPRTAGAASRLHGSTDCARPPAPRAFRMNFDCATITILRPVGVLRIGRGRASRFAPERVRRVEPGRRLSCARANPTSERPLVQLRAGEHRGRSGSWPSLERHGRRASARLRYPSVPFSRARGRAPERQVRLWYKGRMKRTVLVAVLTVVVASIAAGCFWRGDRDVRGEPRHEERRDDRQDEHRP